MSRNPAGNESGGVSRRLGAIRAFARRRCKTSPCPRRRAPVILQTSRTVFCILLLGGWSPLSVGGVTAPFTSTRALPTFGPCGAGSAPPRDSVAAHLTSATTWARSLRSPRDGPKRGGCLLSAESLQPSASRAGSGAVSGGSPLRSIHPTLHLGVSNPEQDGGGLETRRLTAQPLVARLLHPPRRAEALRPQSPQPAAAGPRCWPWPRVSRGNR